MHQKADPAAGGAVAGREGFDLAVGGSVPGNTSTARPLEPAAPAAGTTAGAADETERFLALLDPNAKFFTFQTFDDNKERHDRKLAGVRQGTLAGQRGYLKRLNDQRGAGIFVTINETDGRGRKAENVTRVRALFVDLDGAPLDPVLHSEPLPHVVTETSPGRYQAYWLVRDVPLNTFSELQKALAAKFYGDPSVHDLSRVMRLPGFWHRKGKPHLSRIVHVREGERYSVDDFSARVVEFSMSAVARKYAGEGVIDEPKSEWQMLNEAAMQSLSAWVPALFGDAAVLSNSGVWRVSSKDLGRDLEEDLSLSPKGIKDFGVYDMGDARGGKRTPIDVVMEHGHKDFKEAVDWLRAQLGRTASPKHAVAAKPGALAKPQRPKLTAITKNAADLQTRTFEPLRWIVPNYVVEGLTVLAGRPKVGKSFLALNMAVAVALGEKSLGSQCEEADVLGLFLEDSDRRLQRRLTRMLGAYAKPWPKRLTYATEWPRLADGGLDLIREWTKNARAAGGKPQLIIVDILERVRQRSRERDKVQYSDDYEALAAMQKFAGEEQLAVLVVHHQRKEHAEDLIDTLSGTLGLGGACDAFLILGREKNDPNPYLYGRGRDLDEFTISVRLDEHWWWQKLGDRTPDEPTSPERGKIIAVLRRTGKLMSVANIASAIGGKQQNVKALLSKLCSDGVIVRAATGLYELPSGQGVMDI